MERFGIKRRRTNTPREDFMVVVNGKARWSIDAGAATLWNSELKALNVMASQCDEDDHAEVFVVEEYGGAATAE